MCTRVSTGARPRTHTGCPSVSWSVKTDCTCVRNSRGPIRWHLYLRKAVGIRMPDDRRVIISREPRKFELWPTTTAFPGVAPKRRSCERRAAWLRYGIVQSREPPRYRILHRVHLLSPPPRAVGRPRRRRDPSSPRTLDDAVSSLLLRARSRSRRLGDVPRGLTFIVVAL